jgi:hypothetical protein
MGSSSLTVTDTSFQGGSGTANNTIVLTVKNTGTKQVTIGTIRVNSFAMYFTGNATLSAGDANKQFTVYMGTSYWTNGNPYKIELYDVSGNGVGSTQQNAPGA